ncbi:hypothetical protein Aab01nite_15140 [Paractinoplanes abujensis]|nr:hypothetical protein Aab01nite_15140 [Actinoplanes abujensis]
MAGTAGVDQADVNAEQANAHACSEVLDYTGRNGLTRNLVAAALEETHETSPHAGS